jgi:hypothetical protein
MPRISQHIDIARLPEDVFAFLADFGNDSRWRANVLEMKPLGQPGDVGGIWSRQVEVRRIPGRAIESEAVVTASEPARLLSVRRATGPIRPEASYRLEPFNGGTRLTFKLEVALAGATWLILPLVWLLLMVVVGPALSGDLARLKEKLESGAECSPQGPNLRE